ncbi:hypothetical protein ACVINZ_001589 [Mesorhizobium jarvisii]
MTDENKGGGKPTVTDLRKGYQPTRVNVKPESATHVQGGYKPASGSGAPKVTPTTGSGGKK